MRLLKTFYPVLVLLMLAQQTLAYEIGNWDVHGTVSQGLIHSKDNNFIDDSIDGTFDFREFGLNASRPIGERITVGGQVFGRKYGVIGDDDLYLDWLSITYALRDEAGFRAGRLKMPYGLYGETRDIDSLRTQILLPQGVYAETYRGAINAMLGVAVFGTLSSAEWGSLDYSAQLGQTSINKSSGEINRLASDVEVDIDDVEEGDAGALKLLWNTPVAGLRVGTTLTKSEFTLKGPTDSLLGIPGAFRSELGDQYSITSSLQYAVGRLTFSIEHLYNNNESDFNVDITGFPTVKSQTRLSANYLHVDYRATQGITLGAGLSNFTVKQKTLSFTDGSSFSDKQEGYYFSLRYDITPNLIAKLEQHFSTGQVGLFLSENPDGLEDDWSMTLAKISFLF